MITKIICLICNLFGLLKQNIVVLVALLFLSMLNRIHFWRSNVFNYVRTVEKRSNYQ